MELLAVLVMIVVGGAVAVFVLIAIALAKGDARAREAVADRDQIAASILYQVLVAGGSAPDDALREIRRGAGLGARVTRGVDITSWGESYARVASDADRARLLESAVQFAAARKAPVPLRQYAALLDLSFALGFHTDALARLRERYGFEYVDHAKDARPREADRGGGAMPLFVRDESRTVEWLRVLQIEGTPTRPIIISAYRRLAAKHHPDKFHEASDDIQRSEAARFIEITRAYEHLLAIFRD
ncbi:MAG TPA: J domain-containing protein [Thermoanaerobaculia bacterium]